MNLRSALLASAMMALPIAAANAQAISGPYINLGAGVNIMQDEEVKSIGGLLSPNTNLQTKVGGTGILGAGWGFGNGFRAEMEFDYRYNGLKSLTAPGGASATLSGSEQKYGPMFNVVYDFTTISPMVVPYIGLGAGYQWAAIHAGGTTNNEGAFAYQAILGAELPIPSVPGLGVTAEYRFMGLAGNRNYPGVTLGNDFNHSILIGLRYAFGAPAVVMAAPMPVADMGAKTFLVFFDWDKYNLTARSEGIVHDAAAYSTHSQYTRIDVDGNADTSGTPAYNQGLSERRARTVAAELVRDGVPQSAISMHAYGDTKLLVPTGPNTREPQNRRVEIVFH
jgi:OOP family OmpA-OmpF porin